MHKSPRLSILLRVQCGFCGARSGPGRSLLAGAGADVAICRDCIADLASELDIARGALEPPQAFVAAAEPPGRGEGTGGAPAPACCHLDLVVLPDGTPVGAVSLAAATPDRPVPPDFALVLDASFSPPFPHAHLDWPDGAVPGEPGQIRVALADLLARARRGERVEVGCTAGHGRTGTALACLAVLAGLEPAAAVDFVRAAYCEQAVETDDQARFVEDAASWLEVVPSLARRPSTLFSPYGRELLPGVLALCRAEGWPTLPADEERAHRALSAPGVVTLVAHDHDEVVGFAQVLSDGASRAYLANLVVTRHRRRQGIGTTLVRAAFARAGGAYLDLIAGEEAAGFYVSFPDGNRFEGFRLRPPL